MNVCYYKASFEDIYTHHFYVFKLINISKPIAGKVLIKPCLKHEAFVVFVVCVEIWAWSNAHFSK